MAQKKPIVIDGGVLEGGGQILRNAAALSCLLEQPITVNNIRAGRDKPGLRPQHQTGLQLLEEMCHGKMDGNRVGATEITFNPGKLFPGSFEADTKTAGSICLLLQAAFPCMVFTSGVTQLTLKGGTNADMAPQIDYFTMVFGPIAERFGLKFDCNIKKRGFYPKGGGVVEVQGFPNKALEPVTMTTCGEVVRVYGRSFVAGLPVKVAHSMASAAQTLIKRDLRQVPVDIEVVEESKATAVGIGTGVILVAETSTGCLLSGSALGKRGVPAAEVGENAARMLMRTLSYGVCVDEYLQDQLIILMALARGKSEVLCGPVTLHTETAIHVAKLMTKAKFEIKKLSETQNIISCEGIELVNDQL